MNNQWHIVFDDDNKDYGNSKIYQQGFKLQDGICSDNTITFGSLMSKCVEITLVNDGIDRIGQWFSISVKQGNTTHSLGRYKVAEEKLNNDRSSRVIKAYDIMRDIINTNYSSWYTSLAFPMTLKTFFTSFATKCGIQVVDIDSMWNDDMGVTQTIIPETLTGKDILSAILELNGGFGRINFENKLEWNYNKATQDALVPALSLYPQSTLYPKGDSGYEKYCKTYKSEQHEDYVVSKITKCQIRTEENDIGGVYGDGNTYIIENNFLCYGKTTEQLQAIASNFVQSVSRFVYTPCDLCMEWDFADIVGEPIKVFTRHGDYKTIPMSVTISGTQGMMITISADGEKAREEQANGVHSSILALAGKTNSLKRTVEELNSVINDQKTGLQSQITQNANAIQAAVIQSYSGNFITKAMYGNNIISVPTSDCKYGISGYQKVKFGPVELSSNTYYNVSYRIKIDDISAQVGSFTYIWFEDENGNHLTEDMVDKAPDHEIVVSNQFQITSSSSKENCYLVIEPQGEYILSDIQIITGAAYIPWTPNRQDEYAMINMTSSQIEAKVSKTGDNGTGTFSWELLADGFILYSNGSKVFECNQDGIEVNGYTKTDELEAYMIEADYVTAQTGMIKSAKVEDISVIKGDIGTLRANDANLNTLITNNVSATTVIATNLQALTQTVNTINANYITANQITTDFILGKLGGRTGTISVGTVNAYASMSLQGHSLKLNQGMVGGKYMYWVSWS